MTNKPPIKTSHVWGTYAPGKESKLLRFLIRSGVSRGVVSKWISRKWVESCPPIVDINIRGIKYRLNIQDNTTDRKLLISSKFYDQEEIQALGTGDVFIDVGANTGYYSLTLAKAAFRRVIAIEPNPPALERLRQNIQFNVLGPVITVVPYCIGNGEKIPFYCNGGLGSASLIRPDNTTSPILVNSKSLIDIVQEQHLTKVDALKIDVEGFEDQALKPFFENAPKSLWPKIVVIENCHRTCWKDDVISHMLKSGYRLRCQTRGNSILLL